MTCPGYISVSRSLTVCSGGSSFVGGVVICTGGTSGSVDMAEVVITICCGRVVGVFRSPVLGLEVVVNSGFCCVMSS